MPVVVEPLVWVDVALKVLDQRRLPAEVEHLHCTRATEVADAIRQMAVRGAPAIGIAAAFGMALAARAGEDLTAAEAVLAESRPTAVNLHWALARMRRRIDAGADAAALLNEAQAILAEDLAQNRRIGELGAALLPADAVVITHCNTGALATGGHGTALGIIRSAHASGRLREVYAGETRPWWQGARLTSWELQQEGIPVQLMVDSAAAHLMRSRKISAVIVGADRIAANGDTANKIGTYALAVAARAHGVPFYVAAPTGSFDPDCADGTQIPIEERPGSEICQWRGAQLAPAGVAAWNPVFDVTPAELITAIISERAVVERPDRERVLAMLAR